jgi:succinate-semialdehyde dehydrogenase/glutarate-semialdehyde dehydrogenase
MAGNTAILKHASNVQICAQSIEEVFTEAGLPKDVFLNIPVSSKMVNSILESDFIKGVSLTGSEGAGSKVASTAGKLIKPSVLELGGSNPFIVLKDADLEKAIDIGIQARMMNGGQSCIAAKRFIVDRLIAEDFVQAIKQKIAELKMGDPMDETTNIGPLSSIEQANLVKDQIDRSIKLGAKCLIGGNQKDAFIEPTLLMNVKRTMPVFQGEVFGPVLSLITFENEEDAIEIANDSRYGLGVSIMSSNHEKVNKMIPLIDDGAVFVNSLVKSDPRLPFGGTKKSGFGRELSREGIREFVNIKTVFIAF